MPQMAPLNWLSLMIMFTMIFMMFNSMNYFSFKYKSSPSKIKKMDMKTNWKW